MKDIRQAANDLATYLDYPPWLNAVVVGAEDGRPAIIIYLTSYPATPVCVLEEGTWEGYPVVSRFFGSFAPMGSC
jgi:hypothetical protein